MDSFHASRLESGLFEPEREVAVWHGNYYAYELPMGGWKESGMGVRHGASGIRKYTRQQALYITRLAPKRDLHYFPYGSRSSELMGRLIRLFYGRPRRR